MFGPACQEIELDPIPPDPFDGHPFRYRLSKGEKIVWPDDPDPFQPGAAAPAAMGGVAGGDVMEAPQEPTREVPAGQGILWSIGGGHSGRHGPTTGATDAQGAQQAG